LSVPSLASDAFISYASQHAAIANAVVAALEKAGQRCWIAPRDVTPGAQYADEIIGAINDAQIVVEERERRRGDLQCRDRALLTRDPGQRAGGA
jgi:hypothetical protein